MKRLILIVLFLAGFPVAGHAGYKEGVDAHKRGDFATALREWKPLARQGNAGTQHNLGVMYERGQGVAQDYGEAVKWYRKAAERGNAAAQNNLGFMYNKGKGVPQDYAEAAKWYLKAAKQGNAVARDNLGLIYAIGKGVPQDYVQAHMWFSLAASKGNPDAPANRDIAAEWMTPAQIAEARKLAREWTPKHK